MVNDAKGKRSHNRNWCLALWVDLEFIWSRWKWFGLDISKDQDGKDQVACGAIQGGTNSWDNTAHFFSACLFSTVPLRSSFKDLEKVQLEGQRSISWLLFLSLISDMLFLSLNVRMAKLRENLGPFRPGNSLWQLAKQMPVEGYESIIGWVPGDTSLQCFPDTQPFAVLGLSKPE